MPTNVVNAHDYQSKPTLAPMPPIQAYPLHPHLDTFCIQDSANAHPGYCSV
jgi:hypothetical protein